MVKENKIGSQPSLPRQVSSPATAHPVAEERNADPTQADTANQDQREMRRAGISTESPKAPVAAGLATPQADKGSSSRMQARVQLTAQQEATLRRLAKQEMNRGRPLVVISPATTQSAAGATLSAEWKIGFDYVLLLQQHKSANTPYVDHSAIYRTKTPVLGIFYGTTKQSNVMLPVSGLQANDQDGNLIASILGVNAPGQLGAAEAEGIGLIAGCMGADYIPTPLQEGARAVLHMLAPAHRMECLRQALLFSCNSGDKALVDALLRLGADVHVTSDDDGSMPLEMAVEKKNISLIQSLLAHGADPDVELSSGMTCRSLAASFEDPVLTALFASIPAKQS